MQEETNNKKCEDCGTAIPKGEEWICWDATAPEKKSALCCKQCSDKRFEALDA